MAHPLDRARHTTLRFVRSVLYQWLIGREVRKRFAEMSRGDATGVLRAFADDVHFVYNGDHALGGDHHPKAAVAAWFERLFAMFSVDFEVHDVVVGGGPRMTRIATRFTAHVTTEDGRRFENRSMQYARIRWGRVIEDRIYPDTQLLAEALEHAEGLKAGTAA